MVLFDLFKRFYRVFKVKRQWRNINRYNFTTASGELNVDLTAVGAFSYGKINAYEFNDDNTLSIGSFCSIAPNVSFIVSADHYVNHLSSFPFKSKIINAGLEGVSKGNIVVEDDVWIGYGATILSGVHISQGAVIAAGAVVTKDVPPYAIVGGVPAKIVKYRFEPDIIDYLLTLDYSALTEELIRDHIEELYSEIDFKGRNEIEVLFDWFPKKG